MHRLAAVGVALVALAGCATAKAGAARAPGAATVARVVDGDTIHVNVGGRDETVRLLGIDTPETHKPNTPVECFGVEATKAMQRLLPKSTPVDLVRDVEARDKYGRLLAYVYRSRDHLFVNLEMVRAGYAAAYTYPPNVAHAAEIVAAAGSARTHDLGLWRSCGGNHVAAR